MSGAVAALLRKSQALLGAAVFPVLPVQHLQLSLTLQELCSRNHYKRPVDDSLNVFKAHGVKRIHLSGAISLFSP